MLTPEGQFLSFYDAYMSVVNLWACSYSAYYAVFDFVTLSTAEIIINTWVLMSFTLDIVFNFLRQYRDVDGRLVDSHWLIASKYLKGWFVFDLVATIPIFFLFGTQNSAIIKLLRLLKLFKLVKVFRFDQYRFLIRFIKTGRTRATKVTSKILIR